MPRTVDEYERDEKDVERTVRPAPKKRQPRMDRRRNRIKTHDPDLEEHDTDTSMNYKTIGGAINEVQHGVKSLSNKLSFLLGASVMNESINMFEGLSHVTARKLAVQMKSSLEGVEDALGCDSCYQDEIILLTDQIDGELKKYLVIPPEQDYWALDQEGIQQLWFDDVDQGCEDCGGDCGCNSVVQDDEADCWFEDERTSSLKVRTAEINTEEIVPNTVTVSFDPAAQVYWVHVRSEESHRVVGKSFQNFDDAEAHANKESKRFGLPVVVNK